jgi:hypothetical protein
LGGIWLESPWGAGSRAVAEGVCEHLPETIVPGGAHVSLEEALNLMGTDETFRATVYAMNTLLIDKGVYSAEEFKNLLIEHAVNFKNGFRGKNQAAEISRAVVPASL